VIVLPFSRIALTSRQGRSVRNDWSKNMKNVTAKSFLVALLSLAASTAAPSQNNQGQNNNNQGPTPTSVRAPEISPAEAMGALALLGGAVAIVRGYRRRQK
jgi:hypothetical protein